MAKTEEDVRMETIRDMLERAQQVTDKSKPVDLTLRTFLLLLEEVEYLRSQLNESDSSLRNYITEVDNKLEESRSEFRDIDKSAERLVF